MTGVDVSSYQSDLDLTKINYDFVLIKATEGTNYVNPHCDTHFQQAVSQGKKVGVYHFAAGGDAVAEANWFVDNCRGYYHRAIFVLDWEGDGVQYTDWALKFLQRVEAVIGYKPMMYMSQSVENAYDWSKVVAGDYGLWLADYSQQPTTKHWPYYVIWQNTSTGHLSGYTGNLDEDIAYLTPDQWDAYAGVAKPTPVAVPVVAPPATSPGAVPVTPGAPSPEPAPSSSPAVSPEPSVVPSSPPSPNNANVNPNAAKAALKNKGDTRMNLSTVSKAVAGGAASALVGLVASVPFQSAWHTLLAVVISYAVGHLAVFFAPANH